MDENDVFIEDGDGGGMELGAMKSSLDSLKGPNAVTSVLCPSSNLILAGLTDGIVRSFKINSGTAFE